MSTASFITPVENSASVPQVQPGAFLTLHYRLAAPGGADFVNTFGGRPATLSLGTGELSPALEDCLLGLAEGSRQTFNLPAGTAFGPRNPELLQSVARKLLDDLGEAAENYQVGDVVQFPSPNGNGQSYAGTVIEAVNPLDATSPVRFDFNHPLAGKPAEFEVFVIGIL